MPIENIYKFPFLQLTFNANGGMFKPLFIYPEMVSVHRKVFENYYPESIVQFSPDGRITPHILLKYTRQFGKFLQASPQRQQKIVWYLMADGIVISYKIYEVMRRNSIVPFLIENWAGDTYVQLEAVFKELFRLFNEDIDK